MQFWALGALFGPSGHPGVTFWALGTPPIVVIIVYMPKMSEMGARDPKMHFF